MFEVYRRKFIEQPFPRQFVGEFETIHQVIDKLKLTPEETIEALTTVSETGYEIEQTMKFLGDGLTQEEIAGLLKLPKNTAKTNFNRAIKKLNKNGKLKSFLIAVSKLRSRNYPDLKYTVTTREEKISVDL